MSVLGTVRLDGETVVCRRRWGAEFELPLRVDVTAEEALGEALKLARDAWHPGAVLARPRVERGGAVVIEVHAPDDLARAIDGGLPRPAPIPDVGRTLAAAIAWRIERTPLAPRCPEAMEAATVRPGGAS